MNNPSLFGQNDEHSPATSTPSKIEPRGAKRSSEEASSLAIVDYHEGVYSIPVRRGRKAPVQKGWQNLRLTPDDLSGQFARPKNRGRLLGIEPPPEAEGGFVVCVDLDTPEAVALASALLPATGEVGGRADCPQSHWFYESTPPPETRRFSAPDGTRLLELLSTGTQVIVPPSIHPTGTPYVWTRQRPRTHCPAKTLESACCRLAAAALLCRRWPTPGCRQEVALALSGALLRGGWSEERTEHFIGIIAKVAQDEEAQKRVATVRSTAKRRAKARTASGWPSVARHLGSEVVDLLRAWLGLRQMSRLPTPVVGPPARSQPSCPDISSRPQPLGDAAYHGLAGQIVRTIEPHTEADPAALLFQFLASFGNVIGSGARFRVEATDHRTNLFCIIVGASSKARKGTSWQQILRVFRLASCCPNNSENRRFEAWVSSSIKDGLSSGEGLIWHVRDKVREWKADNNGGREVVVDGGVRDKRLLIQSGEIIAAIRRMARHGNTLSAVLRCAWDCGDLRILTKRQPVTATGAHISVVGHITAEELRGGLSKVETANGFANRFLWVFVTRSKLLPKGGSLTDEHLESVAQELSEAVTFAGQPRLVERDAHADAMWCDLYAELSRPQHGLSGVITSRAEAQVVRLSLIYALLDRSSVIRRSHLEAALEVWRYAEESVRTIFDNACEDPVADAIARALHTATDGLNRTDIYDLVGRHRSRNDINAALETLRQRNQIRVECRPTGGRPEQRWFLIGR